MRKDIVHTPEAAMPHCRRNQKEARIDVLLGYTLSMPRCPSVRREEFELKVKQAWASVTRTA